jgi:LacI family transcriptional regulator
LVTLKIVAEKAGVSPTTVSRVINNSGYVSEDARRKVEKAIEILNYVPNNAARTLAKKRTNAIGVVVNNLHDPFFHDLIKGFEDGATETSYNIVFCSALGGDVAGKERYVKYLTNGVTDGIVLYGSYLSDESIINYLIDINFPFILIENEISGRIVNNLLIDNVGGAEDAVRYLISLGHKRIAHIVGNPNRKVNIDRMNGYINAMHKNAISIDPSHIKYITTGYVSGYDKMRELMLSDNRPTAVFCSDDAIASYAVRAAIDLGLKVSKDVSVMGFDNRTILPDGYRGPDITTVEQPLYQIGKDSICFLTEVLLNGGCMQPIRKVYSTEIIIKETVGPVYG